jgi:hypothetical protein
MEQVGVFLNGFEVHKMKIHGFSKFKYDRVQPGVTRDSLVLAGGDFPLAQSSRGVHSTSRYLFEFEPKGSSRPS